MKTSERENAIKSIMSLIYKIHIESVNINEDSIEFNMGLPLLQTQNLYTFIFKDCLDWADAEGYDLCPKMNSEGQYIMLTNDNILGHIIKDKFIISEVITPSENRIDAILKACLYIIEENK